MDRQAVRAVLRALRTLALVCFLLPWTAQAAGGSFVQGEGWASDNGGPAGPFLNSVNPANYLYLFVIQEGHVTSATVSDGAQAWQGVLFWYDSASDETMYLMIPSNATQSGTHAATLKASGTGVTGFKAWMVEDTAPYVAGSAVARSQTAPGAGDTINPGATVGASGNDLYYFVVETTDGGSSSEQPVLSAGWTNPALYNEPLPDFDAAVGALNLGRRAGAGGTLPTMKPGSVGATSFTYTGLAWAVGSAGTAPGITLGASPTSITAGGSSLLTWSVTNATSCTASGGWVGTEPTSGTLSVTPAATTTYTLTCTSSVGTTASASATVTVAAVQAPTVSISASPKSIATGSSSTLTWSSTNATSCTASGGWSGTQATSGTASVSPTSTTSYGLSCSGPGGTSPVASTTVTVTAAAAPTVTFSVSPKSIAIGASATLSWSSKNATSCTASGGWSGTQATSGSASVSPGATTTYGLSCTGSGGTSAVSSVTVTVTGPVPTVSLGASPASIAAGGSSTLSWTSTNATACTASGAWSGSEATAGALVVSPTSTSTYTLTCSGSGGSAAASATVSVAGGASGGSFVQGEGWAEANGGPVGPFLNSVNPANFLYLIAIQEGHVTSASVSDGAQTWTGVLYWYDSAENETIYLMVPSNATQSGTHNAKLKGSGTGVGTFKAWIIEDTAPLVAGSAVARSQTAPGAGATINPGATVGHAGNDVYYFVVETTDGGSASEEPVLSSGWTTPKLYNEVLPDFDANVGALNLGRASGAGGTTPTMRPGAVGATSDVYTGIAFAVGH